MDKLLTRNQQGQAHSTNKSAEDALSELKENELLSDSLLAHPQDNLAQAWSVDDAKALRQQEASRLAFKQRWLAPIAWLPVRMSVRFAGNRLLKGFYQRKMLELSMSVNQHSNDAFDGYTPVANDVIAAGGFKAGTNLLMHICHQISELGEAEFDHIQDVMPWPDASQPKFWMNLFDQSAYRSRTGRRVIKTNLPATKVPLNDQAKYIAVTRDPKDCAASSFFYFQSLIFGPTAPPPKMWLEHVASDNAPFGRWDTFTASWYAWRDKPNVLFLRYEKMKNNPVDTVIDIAEFLGVELSDQALDKIVQKTSHFDIDLVNRQFFPATQSMWTRKDDIIVRKGQSGDGAALFDTDQLNAFDTAMEARLAELGSDFPYAANYPNGDNV